MPTHAATAMTVYGPGGHHIPYHAHNPGPYTFLKDHSHAPWTPDFAGRPAYPPWPPDSPQPFQMTCRGWLAGWCKKPHRCAYAHHRTPFLSPPRPYTCWFWSYDGCWYSAETCPYTHSRDALPPLRPRSFGIDQPTIGGRSAAIAHAARRAGFDVGNWHGLRRLLDAVKGANDAHAARAFEPQVHIPVALRCRFDPKHGQGRQQEGWVPNHRGHDFHGRPRVQEIRDNNGFSLLGRPRNREYHGNRGDFQPVIGRKRNRGDSHVVTQLTGHDSNEMDLDNPHRFAKQPRTDEPSFGLRPDHNRAFLPENDSDVEYLGQQPRATLAAPKEANGTRVAPVDLTDTPAKPLCPGLRRAANGHARTASATSRALSGSKAMSASSASTSARAIVAGASTRAVLADVQARMRTFDKELERGRDALRRRWEADSDLQRRELMPQLEELNDRMQAAQDELAAVYKAAGQIAA